MDSKVEYHPLLSEHPADEKGATCGDVDPRSPDPRRRRAMVLIIAIQGAMILALLGVLLIKGRPSFIVNPVFPQVLYSPAQDVLEYKPVKFAMGFGHKKTIYQGEPSPEVDAAWDDLYNAIGISQIPKWQARLLPNKTLPIPADPDNYAVGLAVFHQLHCLNMLRQELAHDYYTDYENNSIAGIPLDEWPDHLSHCLDNLRQALMCSSDISTVVWQWAPKDNRATIAMDTMHSCRNFDRISDWARDHTRQHHFDMFTHIEDDIVIPVIH